MRFTTVFALLSTLAIAISATLSDPLQLDTNAKRFASGLKTPLPPHRRNLGTPVYGAKRGYPSGRPPPTCPNGPVQCCNSVTYANKSIRQLLKGFFGVVVGPNVEVGISCSPLAAHTKCHHKTVCCENNSFNGLVAIRCSPPSAIKLTRPQTLISATIK